jgi:succinate dehydrogenase / fumarate reductase, cytochrome b subunit
MASRPLSPHISIYRFAYTMALSILHRATGMAMSLGIVLLVAWLLALASGPDAYARYATFAGHWPARLVIGVLLAAFCYHFANGIRHLFWDIGWGLERQQARRSARIVVVVAALAAAMLLYVFLGQGAAP